jgi:predicted nucleotidyltransferase
MNPEIMRISEAIRAAVPVERIYLFGSHAYGTPREDSDFDFYLVLPDDGMKPLEAMQRAHIALPCTRSTPVDILAGYISNFEERSQFNTLERKIVRDGVMLYNRA